MSEIREIRFNQSLHREKWKENPQRESNLYSDRNFYLNRISYAWLSKWTMLSMIYWISNEKVEIDDFLSISEIQYKLFYIYNQSNVFTYISTFNLIYFIGNYIYIDNFYFRKYKNNFVLYFYKHCEYTRCPSIDGSIEIKSFWFKILFSKIQFWKIFKYKWFSSTWI